jgi:hypothetical protein
MVEEKIHSLYLQREDTSSHGPYVYRTVPYMEIMACIYTPTHSCDTMVEILLCHNLGAFLAASNCDTALAIHLALLYKLLAGLLLA